MGWLKVIFLGLFFPGIVSAYPFLDEQYPEDRNYTSADRGYKQYGAPSLYKSGKYSLTFDDGPHGTLTPRLLDVLKKYNVKATFFVITSLINERNFPIIKRMLDEGHILSSHGLRHDNSNNITREVWKARVKQSFLDLSKWYKKANHSFDKIYYRFPYAAYGSRTDHHHMNSLREISYELMKDNCIQFAFWDVDSGDWIPGMNSTEVSSNLIASNEGGRFITYQTRQGKLQKKVTSLNDPTSGGVVLQHDIQANVVDATERFLKYAQEKNLSFVRLDEVEEFKVKENCVLK